MSLGRLKIVIPAYNSVAWIRRTLQSVACQTHRDFDVCVLDDASTQEGQRQIIHEYAEREGWQAVFREVNQGALANIVDGVRRLQPEEDDVIVLIDGDDWLFHDRVFERLREVYSTEPVTLTYGQYLSWPRCKVGSSRPIDPEIVETQGFRKMRWRFSHLRTFKYLLWRRIKDQDLRDEDGNYFATAWDLALMFPMLEMAGHSIKYLHDVLYVYNKANPINDDKVRRDEQLRAETVIRARPVYPRVIQDRCDIDGTTSAAIWYNRWLHLRRRMRMPPSFEYLSS